MPCVQTLDHFFALNVLCTEINDWKHALSIFVDDNDYMLIIGGEFILCSCVVEISHIQFTEELAQPLNANKTGNVIVRKADKNSRVKLEPKTFIHLLKREHVDVVCIYLLLFCHHYCCWDRKHSHWTYITTKKYESDVDRI